MDNITSSVKDLYEKYPYPYTETKGELLKDLFTLVFYILSEAGLSQADFSKYSFLDGGCGAGQRVLGLASELPDASFTCVDMTEHSLEIARQQAQKHQVHNVTFQQADLVNLDVEGHFDVVTSVGVIHHLSEPETGLRNLSERVKDDGIIIVHVYHTLGEFDRMLKREITRILHGNGSLEDGIRTMKELGFTLPEDQYGAHGYNPNLTDDDNTSKDADVFLHPRVFTYRFDEGVDLFRSTDLDWVAINSINSLDGSFFMSSSFPAEPYALNPADYLSSDFLQSKYAALSVSEKFRVLECFARPTAFSLVAGKEAGLCKVGERVKNNLIWLKRRS